MRTSTNLPRQGQPHAQGVHLAEVTAAVIVVEEDTGLCDMFTRSLPKSWELQSVSALEALDGVRLRPSRSLVLVLGPSQARETTLARVAALLRSTPGTGAVLIVDEPTAEVMRATLRAGVGDALALADVPASLATAVSELASRLEEDLAAATVRSVPQVSTGAVSRGFVTTVFSPKGGVGKSVVAVNLATALAQSGQPVAILDLDLQFGDVAVMMRLQPRHTFTDAISAGDLLDETLLRSFIVRHDKSGVYVLSAPTSPSDADQVEATGMLRVLSLLRDMFAHVVVDTPPHLSEMVLQAVSESDTVAFLVAMDVPSVKNARLGLQAFDLLQIPPEKVVLLLNRSDSRVHLAAHDIERVLETKIGLSLPSEETVPQSVNQGVPAFLEYPGSRFVGQIRQLSELVMTRAAAPEVR